MKRFLYNVKRYFWNERYLFRECTDNIMRRPILDILMNDILDAYHTFPAGDLQRGICMMAKVLKSKNFWKGLYHDVNFFVKAFPQCQMHGNISQGHELPLYPALDVELFMYGFGLHGSFLSSFRN